jgi:cobyrinic acid a,c-diamide synthase
LGAIGISVLGALPPHPALELPSRHLGLLPPREVADLRSRVREWIHLAETHLALDRLWPLLAAAPAPTERPDPITTAIASAQSDRPMSMGIQGRLARPGQGPVVIAQDEVFHFLYPEISELLTALGLRVQPWSPLADEPLPDPCGAVVLPGGYPELHGAALAAAQRSRASLAEAHQRGVPIIAECGGLLYLGRGLMDANGATWPMAGVLPFEARPGTLSLGYRQARAQRDGLVARAGERFMGHEFHRWQLHPCDPEPAGPSLWQLEGWGVERSLEGWTTPTLHASWLHLHWGGFPRIPLRLADAIAGDGTPSRGGDS